MMQRADTRSQTLDAGLGSVLMVEDNLRVSEEISLVLEHAGWRVRCAPDGQSFRQAVAELAPTLVVLEDLGAGLAAADLPALRAALRVATAVEGCSVLMTSPEPRLAGLADQRISLDAVAA